MKIAVVGSGIAGLGAAYLAQTNGHQVHLFEKANYFGGHSNTIMVNDGQSEFPVDTGFLVHNPKTYPNLIKMFSHLGVSTVDSSMTLSIRIENENIEWGGESLATVFAQKKNILNIRFLKMVSDILHFNKNANQWLAKAEANPNMTLGELLRQGAYSRELAEWYIVPMAAAIWSTPAKKILDFPAFAFLQFCMNHNLLQVDGRPTWRTVVGGSREYVKKITDKIEHKFLRQNIKQITRQNSRVQIYFTDRVEEFDQVILAAHANTSLSLLHEATSEERDILSSFQFQPNRAVVHCDAKVLPHKTSIWSAWNYLSQGDNNNLSVNYLINKLQSLPTEKPIIVSLNPTLDIDPQKIFKTINYDHPIFDAKAIQAQGRVPSIQGKNGTYFVGAWQGYGFHEDGLNSSLRVAQIMGWKVPWN